jgi:hypothetical protein
MKFNNIYSVALKSLSILILFVVSFYGGVQFEKNKTKINNLPSENKTVVNQAPQPTYYNRLTEQLQSHYRSNELGIEFSYPDYYYVYQDHNSTRLFLSKYSAVDDQSGVSYHSLSIGVYSLNAQEMLLTDDQRLQKKREEIDASKNFYNPIIKQEKAPQPEAQIVKINGMNFIKEVSYLEGSENAEKSYVSYTLFKGSKSFQFSGAYSNSDDLLKIVISFKIT